MVGARIAKRMVSSVALVALLALGCGGGGGGSSPTEPPPPLPYTQVRGSWSGIWVAPVTVSMVLEQTAGEVTGELSALGFTFDVRGTVTQGSATSGRFDWEVFGAGCGTWTGRLRVDGDRMDGPSELSTLGCSDPDRIRGRMFLSREGGPQAATESSRRDGGSLEELIEEMGALR